MGNGRRPTCVPPHPLIAKFRIYPRGRWHYFSVFIWKRRADMRRTLKECHCPHRHTEAICCANRIYRVPKRGPARVTGCLGQLHFHRGSFCMGVITHECGHAALYWANEVGVDPTRTDDSTNASGDEESFCWVLGNMARQVVLKAAEQWDFDGRTVENVVKYD